MAATSGTFTPTYIQDADAPRRGADAPARSSGSGPAGANDVGLLGVDRPVGARGRGDTGWAVILGKIGRGSAGQERPLVTFTSPNQITYGLA